MNCRSLLIFLVLNKSKNEFLTRAAPIRPRATAHGGVAACHVRPTDKLVGPRPGGPIQHRKWPAERERGVHTRRGHRVQFVRAMTRWWLACGKVLSVSSWGP
jgi:hypothetical protein